MSFERVWGASYPNAGQGMDPARMEGGPRDGHQTHVILFDHIAYLHRGQNDKQGDWEAAGRPWDVYVWNRCENGVQIFVFEKTVKQGQG